ncbi:MupA/Atu3671 family FMN-dependent luciferase-like monooxygenase [Actinokineospora sp. NBRC 105648]|uniref:MupA/Atu3671 family FMN-dependent luciferase-like monooxygenase n=1 Tax=Actinokineospora sp. NBRC 105648 TaxID=3032206 RepID=UPI0024A5E7CE|nr:MupA/Atu3671 family FMN-dependent luciferase-like monooxygenase [Actinokineospora sp. NBRC 105648]GLZ39382.1 siderophore biosynthesis protein [Actinokineospora sp. NBRC 105648]
MDFSLLYFANREVDDAPAEYDLLLRAARFADEHGFTALWLPERHFHPFGGAYPNPALAAAALATVTSRIRLRAGSVVLPLHDPLTVAEDWAFVDNLSRGRVDLAIATGWNPNDFVLAPDAFADRRARLPEQVGQLRDLWAGKSVTRRNGAGAEVEVTTYPRPAQDDVELWLTCSSSLGTFELAGALGANVLTALLFQRVDELAPKLAAYREALVAHGHDPAERKVTLMVHTFVGESDEAVRATVREPFTRYLKSSVDLWKGQWSELDSIHEDRLLDYAFERYFRTAALFGSVPTCARFVDELRAVGVTEVASLIDFGVDPATTLRGLSYLDELRAL